jgi:hypothetical protein
MVRVCDLRAAQDPGRQQRAGSLLSHDAPACCGRPSQARYLAWYRPRNTALPIVAALDAPDAAIAHALAELRGIVIYVCPARRLSHLADTTAEFDLRVYANRNRAAAGRDGVASSGCRGGRATGASEAHATFSATSVDIAPAHHTTLLSEEQPCQTPKWRPRRRPPCLTSPRARPPSRRACSPASRSTTSSWRPMPAARSPRRASSGSPAC